MVGILQMIEASDFSVVVVIEMEEKTWMLLRCHLILR